MICYNCKAKLKDNVKYCPRCGTLFPSDDVMIDDNNTEQELIDIYFQNKHKFNIFNISLGYLLFNFSYAFYKKMYNEGIIGGIFTIILIKTFSNWEDIVLNSMGFYFLAIAVVLIASIFINIYYIFNFNKLYLSHVKYRVNKIVRANNDMEKIRQLCIKDKKGNIIMAVFSMIIFLLIILFM